MSHAQIAIIKFLFRGELEGLDDALVADSKIRVDSFSKCNELISYLSTTSAAAAVVVASIHDKSDLIELSNFISSTKNKLKNTFLKIVVINHSRDKNFEKLANKLGVRDFVEPSIGPRMIAFKLDLWIRSLRDQIKKSGSRKLKVDREKDIEDLTADVQVSSYLKQGELHFSCQLDDFFENTIIFSLAQKGLNPDEAAEFIFSFDFENEAEKLNVFCRIESIEEASESIYVTVKIKDSDVPALSKIMNLYEVRQQNIREFITRAKGL